MNKIKSIHFVGIKGVGMTPLAIIAKEAGIKVSGSDIDDEFITDAPLEQAHIVPSIGFSKDHINNVDLVITTGAHGGFNNIEVKEAKKLGIKVITQGEAVGKFMEGAIFDRSFKGISVAGTHGKTTTTAMVATIFKESGLDPSFVVGTGFIPSLSLPGHYGKGQYFVAEADEYATEPNFDKTAKFLWQHPKIGIFTNIEFDHPDIYKSIDEIREVFLKFANQLPKDGVLIVCGDSKEVKKLLKEFKGKVITYGFLRENEFVVRAIKTHGSKTEFIMVRDGRVLAMFSLNAFGNHNILNATASIITSMEVGLSIEQIKSSLLKFMGTKRRSEYIGQLLSGTKLYDDYAHHPTKIKATLAAFRSRFPKSKIVCIFQPHTYSRTKSLFEQFSRSFNDADIVIITSIYASLREKKDPTVSAERLADAIRRSPRRSPFGHLRGATIFLARLEDVVEYIDKKKYGEDTIIITMGAGNIYKINSKFEYRNPKQIRMT